MQSKINVNTNSILDNSDEYNHGGNESQYFEDKYNKRNVIKSPINKT